METQLKKLYFRLLAPALLGFPAAYLLKTFMPAGTGAIRSFRLAAPGLFVLAFTFGAALPLLFRTLFVNRNRTQKRIPENDLLKFERNTLYITLVTPYIALAAYFLEIPRFHFAGTVLAGLYGVYYFYPSRKRIRYEKRIFRVK